jgi:hypothetical protein
MNTTEPNTIALGGHRVQDTGTHEGVGGSARVVWRCIDCQSSGTSTLFESGYDGCPMRPESLDYLSVCPGGDNCEGHMDTSTPEYRAWKESPSMPKEQVPRFTCDASKLGLRAARQWLKFADKIGITIIVWSSQALAGHIGAGGGVVAELLSTAGAHHIVVTRHGKLRAHRGNDLGCQDCATLTNNKEITA